MTPVLVSVDKAGDLKLGRKKCRLHKKADVVKVAKKYGIVQAEKLTVKELCGGIKMRAKNSPLARDLLRHAAKRGVRTDNLHLYNNVPLAKLYPEAAKKRAAAKKKAVTPSMKAALKKKAVTNFMKGMVTSNSNIKKLRELNEKPSKKAQPLTKDEARKRIKAMKGLSANNKFLFVNKLNLNQQSPRRVVRMAREMARLR